jgi:hypothetical protein
MSTPTDTREPGALSGPLVGLSFVAGLAAAMARSAFPFPRPGSDPAQIRRYFTQPSGAPWLSVAGQAISAAALVRFTASVARLAGRSGEGARGLRAAAVAGGGLAAASLATSALCAAALAGGRGERDASAVALHRRGFLAGGPVHGAGFGVLVGTLGLAGLRTGELPRSLAITGLGSAVAGLLSLLYLVTEPAAWFIPIGRFSGLIVSGIAGVRLSRRPR